MSSTLPELASRFASARSDLRSDQDDADEDDIFARLEAEIEDDDNVALREHGMQELKQEMERLKSMKDSGHGRYDEITDEKEVIRTSAREPRCIIHFYHSNFKRCEIMDKHLSKLAPKYFSTRFLRVFVENVPWLVEKLGVKVLPCVVCFQDGVSKARIVGFDELGNSDEFETATLEWKLLTIGVIVKESSTSQLVYGSKTSVRQQIRGRDDDDFEFDLE